MSSGEMLRSFILAARPKTLTAALIPVVVGSALAFALRGGELPQWVLSLGALLSALAIQIGTNLFNDVLDFERGADTSSRLGPCRVTQQGMLVPQTVFRAGIVFFSIALALGVLLVWHGGWPIFIIGTLSLICGYCYTGGPFPLAYRGLGDLFVLIFFGVIAVGGTVLLNTGHWPFEATVAGLQVGSLAVVLIAINNLRDIDGDRLAGKHTLAVRLGLNGARHEIDVALALPFALGLYWLVKGYVLPAIFPLILIPYAHRLSRLVKTHEPGTFYNVLLGRGALLQLLFGALLTAAFLLGALHGS